MTLKEICGLNGVKDIEPLSARAKFAQALRAEALGEQEKAGELLNQAVILSTQS